MKPVLVFDMNGVIVDNTAHQARVFRLLFRDLSLSTNTRQLLKHPNGVPTTDILKSIFRHLVPAR